MIDGFSLMVSAGRSTALRQNSTDHNLKIYISAPTSDKSLDERLVYVIIEAVLAPLNHMAIRATEGFMVLIPPKGNYMVLNLSPTEINLTCTGDITLHNIIFDPYHFAGSTREPLDPQSLVAQFPIPPGYHSILPKWYSVKFSYAEYNLICLRPGWGISLQAHTKRAEHWEIVQGVAIVIAGAKVLYNCKQGQQIAIPWGEKHAIWNPSLAEWVLLKETYEGIFEEEDIVRIFNPNQY